jgi:hypothetical protein
MPITTPNMGLTESVIGTDSGLSWEQNLNSSLPLIDVHDHSPGKGVPIESEAIFLTADLSLNDNNLTLVRSVRFEVQAGELTEPSDINCSYETGVDFWFNDANGNKIQITRGGAVNATSSGITSGTASAFFISNVLVVNSNVSTPANIQVASLLLGNNILNSNYLTLLPPASMAVDYSITAPTLPVSQKIMTLDNFGDMSAPYVVDNSTIVTVGNVISVPASGITDTQIAFSTIGVDKRIPMTSSGPPAPVESVLIMNASIGFTHTTGAGVLVAEGYITTSGRPLKVMLQPNGAGLSYMQALAGSATSSPFTLNFMVDGVPYQTGLDIAVSGVASPGMLWSPSMMNFVAPVSAGFHTIVLFMVAAGNAQNQATLVNTNLVAYEI